MFFLDFSQKITEKTVEFEHKRLKTALKRCFKQFLDAHSTQKLVKIHNILHCLFIQFLRFSHGFLKTVQRAPNKVLLATFIPKGEATDFETIAFIQPMSQKHNLLTLNRSL